MREDHGDLVSEKWNATTWEGKHRPKSRPIKHNVKG
jgi:hypothetical protein